VPLNSSLHASVQPGGAVVAAGCVAQPALAASASSAASLVIVFMCLLGEPSSRRGLVCLLPPDVLHDVEEGIGPVLLAMRGEEADQLLVRLRRHAQMVA